jgi:ADP-heptose:LPS heptosyltransferase
MKLLTAKKRKIVIVFAGGLGDTLLYVPLMKELKKKQFHITCIFYARDKNHCLFDTTLFDHAVTINSKAGLIFFALTNIKRFVNFYINHLANGKMIYLTGRISSKRVTRTSNHPAGKNKTVRNVPIETDLSEAEQNLHLLYNAANAKIKGISSFYISQTKVDSSRIKSFVKNDTKDYYIIQVAAGNNSTPFKNWPIQNWLALVAQLCDEFKHISFIIVGDEFEKDHAAAFEQLNRSNCQVLIGQTSIPELFDLVAFGKGYIGLDSGIMHMAASLQKKTITIFGASDEKLYGYSQFDGNDHKVITLPIYCRPCSAWRNANTSRVTDAMQCPDFACLTGIKEEEVYQQVVTHFDLR